MTPSEERWRLSNFRVFGLSSVVVLSGQFKQGPDAFERDEHNLTQRKV